MKEDIAEPAALERFAPGEFGGAEFLERKADVLPAVATLPPAVLALAADVFHQVLTGILEVLPDADRRRCGQVCRRWRAEIAAINVALTRWVNIVPASAENQFTASAEITFHNVARCATTPAGKREFLWSPDLVFATQAEAGRFCFCVRLGETPGVVSTYVYPLQPNWLKGKKLTFTMLFPTGAAALSKAALMSRTTTVPIEMLRDHAQRKDGMGYGNYNQLNRLPRCTSDTLSFIVGIKDNDAVGLDE